MPDRERKRVPDHRSDVLKGSLSQGPPAHHRNMEYPRLSEEGGKKNRDEATQRGIYSNSKHWFTTSFLQPLPYLVTT